MDLIKYGFSLSKGKDDIKRKVGETDNKEKKTKQEAHGPNRSPEKTFQINKHI